jgi:hypothetical protein
MLVRSVTADTGGLRPSEPAWLPGWGCWPSSLFAPDILWPGESTVKGARCTRVADAMALRATLEQCSSGKTRHLSGGWETCRVITFVNS